MKKLLLIWILAFMLPGSGMQMASAQCSICARNTQQLGERPAKALNAGIIYLALAPLTIAGIIGYRWWKSNQSDAA